MKEVLYYGLQCKMYCGTDKDADTAFDDSFMLTDFKNHLFELDT